MSDLLNKPNMPLRIAEWNAIWSVAVVLMYLILRVRFGERVGHLETTGILVGVTIGTIWAIVTLVRAFLLARKGIFVESWNRLRTYNWKLFWVIVEIAIPFAVGYCCLLFAKAKITDFKFSDAIVSLILFLLFTYLSASSLGYYFLEWLFGRKFFDRYE
jgi:hypothetical protein